MTVRVDIYQLMPLTPFALGTPLEESVPDEAERAGVIADLEAEGYSLIGGGAAPGFIVYRCGTAPAAPPEQ